ncbi:MAG: 30S ribosomal protein S12 methylthiotransferase RimO [Candidatus Marinimicrobia bacterium]|nr:30S ribosomal protein S12 methylthiotransferase RimO [Candidatus Neomarinimicrobiota bacterium]
MKKYTIISLGCPKNTVDSEVLKGSLNRIGFTFTEDVETAEIIIINTCGFIKDAKEESIETILEAAELKKEDPNKKVIAFGCLTERYHDELVKEMPEVDAVFGIDSQAEIIRYLTRERFTLPDIATVRDLMTPPYQAYLKIAEGCDNKCAFCAIPGIRGPQHSRTIEDILREAEYLQQKGVKEVVLTAQDLTRFGRDNYGTLKLFELADELLRGRFFHWVRIMYTNPDFWNPQLLELYNKYPELCRYLDIPVQHAADRILKLMNRGRKSAQIRNIITEIRKQVPDMAIRTSIITGFPTESEDDFIELLDFVEEMRFERLGVFTYSEEEETQAAEMNDDVPEEEKERRRELLMETQYDIASDFAKSKVGQEIEVMIEKEDKGHYIGRTMWDAPEVDCFALVKSNRELQPGEFCKIKVIKNINMDLYGENI